MIFMYFFQKFFYIKYTQNKEPHFISLFKDQREKS